MFLLEKNNIHGSKRGVPQNGPGIVRGERSPLIVVDASRRSFIAGDERQAESPHLRGRGGPLQVPVLQSGGHQQEERPVRLSVVRRQFLRRGQLRAGIVQVLREGRPGADVHHRPEPGVEPAGLHRRGRIRDLPQSHLSREAWPVHRQLGPQNSVSQRDRGSLVREQGHPFRRARRRVRQEQLPEGPAEFSRCRRLVDIPLAGRRDQSRRQQAGVQVQGFQIDRLARHSH